MSALLSIENLEVSYGPIAALKGVSLQVPQGRIACLIGANGAGKSTVLKAVSGLLPVKAGAIALEGVNLCQTPAHRIVGLGLTHCPEGRGVFPELRVDENLMLGAYTRPDRAEIERGLTYAYELFPRLFERRSQLAGTLSGGEQQMLAIGRSLMSRPKLLMLDEPSLGLAPQIVEMIFGVIQKINAEGCSVLLVEQNAHQALAISHYAYVLETGSIALEGPAQEVAKNPKVIEAYLG